MGLQAYNKIKNGGATGSFVASIVECLPDEAGITLQLYTFLMAFGNELKVPGC